MSVPLVILSISFVVALAMSGILFVIAKSYPKNIRGLMDWSLSALILALSLSLFIARGTIPDLLSIVLANLMLLTGFMLMNRGLRKFSGTRSKTGRPALVLFVSSYVLLLLWFTYVQPDIGMRVATQSLFTLAVIVDQLIIVLKQLPGTTGRKLLGFSLTLLIASRVARLAGLIFGYDHPTGVFDTSISQLAFIAIPSVTIPLGTISLIMLASEKLRQDLEFTSRHDDLTQCLNKKSALDELKREISRAKRHGNRLSIMIVDLDNFKDINDTHGHLEGDNVLIAFSRNAKSCLRKADQLSRFGGDEFMAILPDTSLELASLVANRFHGEGIESQPIAWSVSIGVAEWLGQDDSVAALLTRADEALYKAKACGRNQTQAL